MESLIKIFLDKGKLVLVISSLLMLCSCISINDSNIEVSSEEYVAEIKGLLGRSEFVSAAQQIYAAEIMDNPVIKRTEILELWQETISTLKNGIDRKNEEGDYLKAIAYSKTLNAISEKFSILDSSKADVKKFYLYEINKQILKGNDLPALTVGLQALLEYEFTNNELDKLYVIAKRLNNSRAISFISEVSNKKGFSNKIQSHFIRPSFSEIVQGVVTIIVDNGYVIREGFGTPKKTIGTGFYIDSQGYLLTNYHVIRSEVDPEYEGYSRLYVMLPGLNNDRVPATIVGYDRLFDLALLKVEIKPEYVFTSLEPVNLVLGEEVKAVGSPGGLPGTITSGIISSTSRNFLQLGDAFQIDTPLNPGNSGGPLLNRNGELIGIVFAGLKQFDGINFAISYDWIQPLLPSLYNGGEVSHFWIGASVNRNSNNLVLSYIVPGSPADLAGLLPGDILRKVSGKEFERIKELQRYFLFYHEPTVISLTFERNSEEINTLVALKKRPFSPIEYALQLDYYEKLLLPLFGFQLHKVGEGLTNLQYRVVEVVSDSVAQKAAISIDDLVRIDEFYVDKEERFVFLRIKIKRRSAGYLDAMLVLSSPLEQNIFI